ncbi:hypothetical protein SOVF_081520 [Spinacia oleracea]|nr:hypothetical protein SOVF_081520 [Spinacia oleracea]
MVDIFGVSYVSRPMEFRCIISYRPISLGDELSCNSETKGISMYCFSLEVKDHSMLPCFYSGIIGFVIVSFFIFISDF